MRRTAFTEPIFTKLKIISAFLPQTVCKCSIWIPERREITYLNRFKSLDFVPHKHSFRWDRNYIFLMSSRRVSTSVFPCPYHPTIAPYSALTLFSERQAGKALDKNVISRYFLASELNSATSVFISEVRCGQITVVNDKGSLHKLYTTLRSVFRRTSSVVPREIVE